jgi:hypothetical protein
MSANVMKTPAFRMKEVTVSPAQKAMLQELLKARKVVWNDGVVTVTKDMGSNVIKPIEKTWLKEQQETYSKVEFIFADELAPLPAPAPVQVNGNSTHHTEEAPVSKAEQAKREFFAKRKEEAKAKTPAPAIVEPVATVSAAAPTQTTTLREQALKAVTEALTEEASILPDGNQKLSQLRAAALTATLYRYAGSTALQAREQVRQELVEAMNDTMRIKLLVDAEIENARLILNTL